MTLLLFLLLGYLIGSTPFAYLLSRFRGDNIFERGSGNPGATNTMNLYGKKAAAGVLLFDIAKGFVPTMLVGLLAHDPTLAFWTGAGAVLGHVFSFYTKFRGGKALATSAGVLLYLHPLALIVIVVLYVVLVLLIRYIVVATTLVIVVAALVDLFSHEPHLQKAALFLMILAVLYRHIPNWERMYLRNEPQIGNPVAEVTLQRLPVGVQQKIRTYFWVVAIVILLLLLIW